jgi:hypothetical protein
MAFGKFLKKYILVYLKYYLSFIDFETFFTNEHSLSLANEMEGREQGRGLRRATSQAPGTFFFMFFLCFFYSPSL